MITLYAATSLDGHLATPEHGLEWLEAAGQGGEGGDYGFKSFYKTVDLLVMGRKTYEVSLGFPEWPHADRETWVLTSQRLTPRHNEKFCAFDAEEWRARSRDRHVWHVGGGGALKPFLEQRLIDRMILSTLPVLLGAGIPLFPQGFPRSDWKLDSCESYPSGLIQCAFSSLPTPSKAA